MQYSLTFRCTAMGFQYCRHLRNLAKLTTRTSPFPAQVHLSGRTQIRSTSKMAVTPLLSVRPVRGLVDEKFQIVVRDLPPGHQVTLHSLHQSEDKDFWEAFGHYVSDQEGTVTVSEHASVGGTYEGIEPMAVLWSMRTVLGSQRDLRLRKKDVQSPMVLLISVYGGHLNEGFKERVALATVVTERWYMAPGVRRVDVTEGGVKGTLFIPPGPGPFPGVLDLWGGGGGLVEYRAALLASHGFVSMALEYFNLKEKSDHDNTYFDLAYRILQDHPQVDSERVALLGLCFGGFVSLTLAAYSKVIHPSCVVCVNGSHALPINISVLAVLENITRQSPNVRVDENNHVIWRNMNLPITQDPKEKIEMGLIKCPLMLVIGEDDQNWASTESAEDIEKMMIQAGNRHLLTILTYPGAGHLIEPPYSPHIRASKFIVPHVQDKVIMLWGGHTKPHAYAQEDSWEKILAFLRQHLYQTQDSAPQAKL